MDAVERGELAAASPAVRQSIYAWSARILAMTDLDGARRALVKAEEIGTSDETVIARAFLQAYSPGGDKAAALASLEPLATPEALTASLMIVAHEEPPSVGLGWWQSTGFPLDRLHPDGKFKILGLQLTADDWPVALSTANALTEGDFHETPALLFLAATANLGQAIHADFREILQLPLPQQLTDIPLQEDADAMGHRAKAIDLLQEGSIRVYVARRCQSGGYGVRQGALA